MKDTSAVLQASVSRAALGTFNSAWLDLQNDYNTVEMNAVIHLFSGLATTNDKNVLWTIEHSADGATSYGVIAGAPYDIPASLQTTTGALLLTAGTAATPAIFNIPFKTIHRYVRLVCVVAGGAAAVECTYEAYIAPCELGKI